MSCGILPIISSLNNLEEFKDRRGDDWYKYNEEIAKDMSRELRERKSKPYPDYSWDNEFKVIEV